MTNVSRVVEFDNCAFNDAIRLRIETRGLDVDDRIGSWTHPRIRHSLSVGMRCRIGQGRCWRASRALGLRIAGQRIPRFKLRVVHDVGRAGYAADNAGDRGDAVRR